MKYRGFFSLPGRLCTVAAAGIVSGLSLPVIASSETEVDRIVVTGIREAQSKQQVAESVSVLNRSSIEQIAPSHPAELLNRMPGVHINNLGGEGHMSSIRQPITTSAVYLFLEDGIPIRPTGFFNHNALYEMNIPQAGRMEVVKGPGSALYGSDGIGGVINVITAPPPGSEPLLRAHLEAGQNGWRRVLTSAGARVSEHNSGRLEINLTDNQGFRENGDYNRWSLSGRLDSSPGSGWQGKTVVSFSNIEQSGVSGLSQEDYRQRPEFNRFGGDIGGRDVEALRLSSEWDWDFSDSQRLTLTPYYRNNAMTLMPSWMLGYDPNLRQYDFESYGLMLKYRQHFETVLLVAGVDADRTPSTYRESEIVVSGDGERLTRFQATGKDWYWFDATQSSVSPYVHLEWDITPRWRMTTGLRYDRFNVDYSDRLMDVPLDPRHLRPDSQSISYQHLSPKWSLLYQLDDKHQLYANYRHGFVAPSVGSLFRPGSAGQSTDLEPTEANSAEIGLRGQLGRHWFYELAAYDLRKSNDIVSIINGFDRVVSNAGKSRHLGLEFGLQGKLSTSLSLSLSVSATNQYYQDFAYLYQCFSPACGAQGGLIIENRNFAGFKVGKAPETLANIALAYSPEWLAGARIEAEWEHLGEYFSDETNTQSYGGHSLLNLRMQYPLSENWQWQARLMNVLDKNYSTYTSNQVGRADLDYRPGQPRTFYMGVIWEM